MADAGSDGMKFWVGVTDFDWFEFLRTRNPDEVNFRQPLSRPLATFLEPGVPFLFKLHSPRDFIVGGGFFVRFSALPARLAWEVFGDKNGVTDYAELTRRNERYRGQPIRRDLKLCHGHQPQTVPTGDLPHPRCPLQS